MFQAVEPVEISFVAQINASEARKRAVSALLQRRGRIKVDDSQIIIARFGSGMKTRLLGAWLAGMDAMPREIKIRLNERAHETAVSVSIRDAFGFGSRAGVSGKLRQLMQADALAIRDAMAPPEHST